MPEMSRSCVWIKVYIYFTHRYKDEADDSPDENSKPKVLYSVEFTFDADARVAITIYCQATEEFQSGMAV